MSNQDVAELQRLLAEQDFILTNIDRALRVAHPDTDISDFAQSFPLIRKVIEVVLENQALDMRLFELEHANNGEST